jgi:diguanylate cyclase (GGDEF)-like protein/PAS domain S-box-containing protein
MPHIYTPSISSVWTTDARNICTHVAEHTPGLLRPLGNACLVDWMRSAHPEDGPQAAELVAAAMAGQQAFRHEHRVLCTDDRTRWVIATGMPCFGKDGQWEGFSGALVDITEHREGLERALRSEAEHRVIVDNSMDLIAHCGADGRYIHVSPSYTRVVGWEAAEMVGQLVVDFLHPDDRARAHGGLTRIFNGEELPNVSEVRKRHRDGQYILLGTKVRKVTDPTTGLVLGAVLVSRDITREKEMLDRIEGTRLALEQAHAHVRTILESIEDGFFSVNTNWEITYANTLAAAFVGVDHGTAIGTVLWDIAEGLAESPIAQFYRHAMARRENTFFEVFYEPAGVWLSARVYAHDEGLSVFFHDISERKHAEARLEQLATRDVLTGLPNRAWLNQHLKAMLGTARSHAATTVLFIDLNRFKEVNDSMGHAAGDNLLQQVSQRLQACMRPGDVVARLGGDEFVVAAHCSGQDAAAAIAQRLISTLKLPFHVDGLEMCVGASIGISLSDQDVDTPERLFQNADTAMYRAKAVGDSSYRFFEPGMSIEARRRLQLEVAMRSALASGQFELHYQPRIDLHTMRIRGMEALLRWNHPDLGRIAPLEFIPIAEERGHIEAIGKWVLRAACREAQRLSDQYGVELHVSVNVSARQLRSAALLDEVAQALHESGLPPEALELELTESALIEDIEQSAELLQRLKHLGVKVSLDDFGTGYSSLSYLKRFPVDVLKLDRSFFHEHAFGAGNSGFVKALIDMAHALGLTVVAEGIETTEVVETLRQAACDQGQGYLFAKPMALPEFEKYLQMEVPGVGSRIALSRTTFA